MKHIFLTLALAVLFNAAHAAPEIKGNPQELKSFLYPVDNVVTISGYADEKAYSDRAVLTLVVTTENDLLSEAIAANSSLRGKLTQQLTGAGIPEAEIKSSKFSSTPQYGWFGKKPSSYKVVNRMTITIDQEAQLKEVAAVSDKYDEVEFSDTAFEHSKEDDYQDQVKTEALEKIIEQKAFYEQTLGVTLTPIGIRNSNVYNNGTRGALVLNEAIAANVSFEDDSFSSKMYREPERQRVQSFDEIKYEANLSVDFKIE